ncbi:MAG TPA: hypothetical protein VF484_07395, partial [Candidatus Limnocylindrales bacterium]
HLRGASDAVLLLTAEVRQLEEHKRGLQPDDPRFEELATAIRRVSEDLAAFTRGEETWAGTTAEPAADGDSPGSDLRPIAETAAPAPLASILERWRSIERRLNDAEPGSAEAAELFEQFERVREEYLAAFEAHEHHPRS